MNDVLAHTREGAQPLCVYRCAKGGIHVFYGCVNIGMPREHFEWFAASAADTAERVRTGACGDAHVTLRYSTTALVLPREEFLLFSKTLSRAAEALVLTPVVPPETALEEGPGSVYTISLN